MTHRVSVITPSYNQGRFIERTIKSVLSQEFPGSLEYLVMDGGSKDETVKILKRYGTRIQWVSEKDRGQTHAVNKGLARATGEIIGWMNSDDIYYPGAIAAACEVFAEHPDVDVVYGNANHIDVDDRVIEPYPTEAWNMARFVEVCYLCQPAVFFRKSVADRFGPLDERLYNCMDYDYWLRLAVGGAKFFWVRHLVAGSRMYAENKTLANHAQSHVEIIKVLRKYLPRVPDRWFYNYAHTLLREKRVSRDHRLRFAALVSAISWYASVRWNHGISREMARTTRLWIGTGIREFRHAQEVQHLAGNNTDHAGADQRQDSGVPPDKAHKMKIGFDISQTGKNKAGCGYFADGLIRQLAATDTRNEYILYPAVGDLFWDPHCATHTFDCKQQNFRRLQAPEDFGASQRFWRHPGEDLESKLGSPEIFHANNFYCPRGLSRTRLVYTLYDLSFLEEPAWTTEENRIGCFQGVYQASLRADYIVAISHYTKDHFASTFPFYPADRMTVIYPASRFKDKPSTPGRPQRLGNLEPGKFWLSVGTIEPRKNHTRLLDAYRILKSETASAYPLVLAGGSGWLMEHFDTCMKGLEQGRDVMLPGYTSDVELQWLFQNCYAFVYPSLFEGFGMPVLEALDLGAAVLCAKTSSLPEAAGDAALYFDPMDPRSIATQMLRLVRGDAKREALQRAARKQAKRFSWPRSATAVIQVYESAMGMPRWAESGKSVEASAAKA